MLEAFFAVVHGIPGEAGKVSCPELVEVGQQTAHLGSPNRS